MTGRLKTFVERATPPPFLSTREVIKAVVLALSVWIITSFVQMPAALDKRVTILETTVTAMATDLRDIRNHLLKK